MIDKNKNDMQVMREDEAFRLAADLWLEKEIEKLEAQPSTPEEDMFVRRGLESIELLLNPKSNRHKTNMGIFSKILVSAACIVLTLFAGLSAAVAFSNPFRSLITNFFAQRESEFTSYSHQIAIPDGWSGVYFPSFIPDGYSLTSLEHQNRIATYENAEGGFFRFTEYWPTESMKIDTENAIERSVQIRGTNATLFKTEQIIYIIWNFEDRVFLINGTIDEDIAIKAAESVKRSDILE